MGVTAPGVATSNVDAARGWDGPIGDFWADNVDRFDTEVADYLPVLLEAVAVAPRDRARRGVRGRPHDLRAGPVRPDRQRDGR